MTTPTLRAGFQNKLYYRSSGTWYELKIIGDVEINDSPEMLDASMRGDGVKRVIPGMTDGKITFKAMAVKDSAAYSFLRTAALAKTPVELGWTDGDTIDSSGVTSGHDWFVLTWKRGEQIGAATQIDIEANPAVKFNGNGDLLSREYWTGTSTTTTTSA